MSSLRTISNAFRAAPRAHTLAHRRFPFPAPSSASVTKTTTSPLQSSSSSSPFHTAPAARLAYKDDQNRESLKPQSTQGSMSGTDQDAADSDAAFDPSTTRPEREKEQAREPSGGNPLETSGANQEKSKPLGQSGGQETHGVTRQENKKSSGGHSPQKKG
ncbi:hypothetical protein VSDG_01306 [Cytospora chrysosperma]|uniref:Uncharacterized protein n=1 Tax=Cytospora chrysosperma TaxID=252740 RepID=A0A423WJ87_CYTCH|nr:hypothetical protein VSDG_01306 [Valsa sordida]